MINGTDDVIAIEELYIKVLCEVPGIAERIAEQRRKLSPEYRREYQRLWKAKKREQTTTYYLRQLTLRKENDLKKEMSVFPGLDLKRVN